MDRARLADFLRSRREALQPEDVGLRILDGLDGAAAEVVSQVGETLRQTRLAVALLGDQSVHTGLAHSRYYRWFTDPAARLIFPVADHAARSRAMAAHLHAAYTRDGPGSQAAGLVDALLVESTEFAELWRGHPVSGPYCAPKRLLHPRVGELELDCQLLVDPDQSQSLVVYTARPGSESHERLRLLSVLGAQTA